VPRIIGALDKIEVVAIERVVHSVRVITVSVVNRRTDLRGVPKSKGQSPQDQSIYQVGLRAYHSAGEGVFVARPPGIHISDDEFVLHEILYRNVVQFAVGHGCAVDWTELPGTPNRAREVRLEWLPATEIFKASAAVPTLTGARALDVEYLASVSDRDDLGRELGKLADAYGNWIEQSAVSCPQIVDSFAARLRERVALALNQNLDSCRIVHRRILESISLLLTNERVFQSFRLANEAIALSMRKARPSQRPIWFPFQLAFILMAIPSSADPTHPDRSTMDLIWFPTGGGKTEAYLGLVAFVLFHRRLSAPHPDQGGGTAVLTRYTLRLLTIQQFERAARIVMACEVIRRRDPSAYGSERFTVGLFVGNSATPGTLEQAEAIISGRAQPEETATTLPLTACPWCGRRLSFTNQRIQGAHVVTRCPGIDCEFHDGIPFACVDDDLYDAPPSMIVGTVDKFAMMAWRPRIREFFGLGETDHQPPSLIIQDELHLIGDALGTITALYETAIDALCAHKGHHPKVVGSTATIRRARKQIRSIYSRALQQFPPSGISHDDSFFYQIDRERPGRLYVGVHAQGRSPRYTLARVMGVLSQGTLAITETSIRDQYHTLVAYFNSLRDLGSAIVLVYDDVRRYIEAMPGVSGKRRRLDIVEELTSYLPSHEIPNILGRLSRGLVNRDENSDPIDVLLSTNMISVGVDIDRLGLMIISGQPKTTSEYIQASSRIGRTRDSAGLVVTIYNWTRPRDRSHYERFRAYHQSFYRYVEATSVTPFSARARDRALHGVLFSLARLELPECADSPTSNWNDQLKRRLEDLCRLIIERVAAIGDSEETVTQTTNDLQRLVDTWQLLAQQGAAWERATGGPSYFLCPPNRTQNETPFAETPMSMRDVDPPSPIRLMSVGELNQIFQTEAP
jgi:hypothetical protein